MKPKTSSVSIDIRIIKEVKKYLGKSGVTIGAFFAEAAVAKMMWKEHRTLSVNSLIDIWDTAQSRPNDFEFKERFFNFNFNIHLSENIATRVWKEGDGRMEVDRRFLESWIKERRQPDDDEEDNKETNIPAQEETYLSEIDRLLE